MASAIRVALSAAAFGNKFADWCNEADLQPVLCADGRTRNFRAHGLRKAAPGIVFEPLNADAVCPYMKLITLEKVRDSLRDWKYEVTVPAAIAERARLAIERMVGIGG